MKEQLSSYEYEPINFQKVNSTTMRISILEDRTKSLEKMLRLFEERLNIKEEEKFNEMKTYESNNALISKMTKKIKNLEKQVNEMAIQKQKTEEENNKTINELNERIKILEEQIKINNEKEKEREREKTSSIHTTGTL